MDNARQALLVALIHPANPRLYHLYTDNAGFKAGIDTLVNALPVFVGIMADQAEDADRFRRLALENANIHTPPKFPARYPSPTVSDPANPDVRVDGSWKD